MSHDFANKKRTPTKTKKRRTSSKKKPVPAWIWILSGLCAGLFIAFLVHLAELAPTAHQAVQTPKPKPGKPAASASPQKPANQGKGATNKSNHSADKDGDRKPRFDFYTLLPKREVPVPDIPAQELEPKDNFQYLLQAGSFRRYEDADKLRAQLILMGMDASIETGSGRGDETWHRILVGPFESRSKLAKARSVLINKNINTLLIKRKLD